VVVGRARGGLAEAAADYEARIAKLAKFEVVVVKDEPLDRGTAAEIRQREADRIEAATADWTVVSFDRNGEQVTSERLAELVGELEERAPQKTAFVVGGAEGIDPRILEASAYQLAFGRATLPHQLARVVAVEQLYRALTIRRGLPYHR
jgi:23S rRNA (pseudouridine1915-N3)-methyltransferase